MNLRFFFSRRTFAHISKLNPRVLPPHSSGYRCIATPPLFQLPLANGASSLADRRKSTKFDNSVVRYIHTSQEVDLDGSPSNLEHESESENDATMSEFLSRFSWIMRKKLSECYPECDKSTIDGMLVIIVGAVVSEMEKGGLEQMTGPAASKMPSQDFSEDLWRTVWEVSNVVLQDMEKEKKKEKMKGFLQSEEVKEMYRFAGQVGIRGDMLRELRFKWAREKMEESEFYESLESFQKGESQEESREEIVGGGEGEERVTSLPKRHGKIKYKIYGLDLSDPKWAEVADKIHGNSEVMSPKEPKPVSGKCKVVAEKIMSLKEGDDPAPLLGEWVELLQPSRIDWIALLDRLKEENSHRYFEIAELVLGEESFQANTRDYSKLIDALVKQNRLEDSERILNKMNQNGILPDVITYSIEVHMYCKSGNPDKAQAALENLRAQGLQPDIKVYNSMIMAYVKAGKPTLGETLMREMETRDLKPTKEIYMALLSAFAKAGKTADADRISSTMQFAGFEPSLESCTLMVEAYGRAGDVDRARGNFDQMIKIGHKPDDRCTASMLSAYEKRNSLDEGLNLLLELEKDGFTPGVATYTVLVDWLSKLELFDEAEQVLEKIGETGEAPPFELQISLCDMYVKAGAEKKALQALGVIESKIEKLESDDFERIIRSLRSGGFLQDARRLYGMMEARGFMPSGSLKIDMMASQVVKSGKKSNFSMLRGK
ncbi:hypothetical protein ABFS82_03G060400 [Erythranthe guttata]|uniref:pentatricopeptide repeat-containing protein At1g63070, mitochondrial n=1 Tax=Erythranthe guttata TaxID=4155 RepID=UPI00064E01CB|nr:PREDICTED: pentatricopeptide repeat-containing protein At1g63070, mitochondrial [Erythranthe guttata]|eukprot:XP_012846095.1 PREDICTED: pentatricopeptide repeat-containing protein At1g63070, mitochondrial [Erythranthe guttata]